MGKVKGNERINFGGWKLLVSIFPHSDKSPSNSLPGMSSPSTRAALMSGRAVSHVVGMIVKRIVELKMPLSSVFMVSMLTS